MDAAGEQLHACVFGITNRAQNNDASSNILCEMKKQMCAIVRGKNKRNNFM